MYPKSNIAIPWAFSLHITNLNTRDAKQKGVQEKLLSYLQYATKSELHVFAHVIRTRGPILFSRLARKQIENKYLCEGKRKTVLHGVCLTKPCKKLLGRKNKKGKTENIHIYRHRHDSSSSADHVRFAAK